MAVGPVEREFKLRLPSAAALAKVRAALGGTAAPPALQLNHFFDTPARALGRAHVGLRLREEGGAAALALKGPTRVEHAGLASREELELALEDTTARAILEGTRDPLAELRASAHARAPLVLEAARLTAGARLVRLGGFENERTRVGPVSFPPGSTGAPLVFELDATRFPGGVVEHELELEVPEGADPVALERALAALFARLGLAVEHAPSKAARFLRALDSGRA